ncbi:MAG TPA: flagellar protein FlaG [Bacillota bacterium]|nr:flagellar protein FlaG [Bacillota bacterium]
MRISGNEATQSIDREFVKTVGSGLRPIEAQVQPEVKQEDNKVPGGTMVPNERAIMDAIANANKVTINHSTRAEFTVHERTKDIMVKIIDTETNQVIREFPPKKFLDLLAKLWDLAGVLVDERR